MTLSRVCSKTLNLVSSLSRPNPASLVATGRDYFVSLGVKRDLTNFVLMTLQDGCAGTSEHVVDTGHTVSTSCRQFVARLVEACIKDFIVVTTELFNALARAHVPKTCSSINATSQAVVSCEVELTA